LAYRELIEPGKQHVLVHTLQIVFFLLGLLRIATIHPIHEAKFAQTPRDRRSPGDRRHSPKLRTHALSCDCLEKGYGYVATNRSVTVTDRIRRTVNFTVRDGAAEIPCCITFEALQQLSRVSGNVADIAEQLFERHAKEIEPVALARYAADAWTQGVVRLDASDFPRRIMTR
jgi:hypothetical protein